MGGPALGSRDRIAHLVAEERGEGDDEQDADGDEPAELHVVQLVGERFDCGASVSFALKTCLGRSEKGDARPRTICLWKTVREQVGSACGHGAGKRGATDW